MLLLLNSAARCRPSVYCRQWPKLKPWSLVVVSWTSQVSLYLVFSLFDSEVVEGKIYLTTRNFLYWGPTQLAQNVAEINNPRKHHNLLPLRTAIAGTLIAAQLSKWRVINSNPRFERAVEVRLNHSCICQSNIPPECFYINLFVVECMFVLVPHIPDNISHYPKTQW
jgi:hypothetical protein